MVLTFHSLRFMQNILIQHPKSYPPPSSLLSFSLTSLRRRQPATHMRLRRPCCRCCRELPASPLLRLASCSSCSAPVTQSSTAQPAMTVAPSWRPGLLLEAAARALLRCCRLRPPAPMLAAVLVAAGCHRPHPLPAVAALPCAAGRRACLGP